MRKSTEFPCGSPGTGEGASKAACPTQYLLAFQPRRLLLEIAVVWCVVHRCLPPSAHFGVLPDVNLGTFDSGSAVKRDITLELKRRRWSEMTKILIGYGTTEGQTARIAQRLAQVIRSRGVEVQVMDLKRSSDPDLDTYDAAIIGGSIHMGKHEDYVCDFSRQNRAALDRLPAAFFSVSLAAHGDMANAEAYVTNFEQETGWRPSRSVSSAAPCSIASTAFSSAQ